MRTVTFLDSGLIHVCKDHDPAGPRFLIHARIAHCTIPVPLAYQGACCAACDGPGPYVSLLTAALPSWARPVTETCRCHQAEAHHHWRHHACLSGHQNDTGEYNSAVDPACSACTRYRIHTRTRLFYGCSYRFHLSGDNSRDRYIKGS